MAAAIDWLGQAARAMSVAAATNVGMNDDEIIRRMRLTICRRLRRPRPWPTLTISEGSSRASVA
jgi:hypothetical protein